VCGVDVGGCVGVYPDRNDLKLGTVVVLDTVSKQTDFEFKGAWDRVRVRVRVTALESWRRFASPVSARTC